MKITVIGAVNIDITAKCSYPAVMRDSNIGVIKKTHGGVGRNIVHNCALLGLDCSFVSAVGADESAGEVLGELKALGININDVYISREIPSGTYICIIDEGGDMLIGLNDMQIVDCINRDFLASCDLSADILALDANLSGEALEYALSNKKGMVFAEPVSVKKAVNLVPFLDKIDIIKPNVYEAEALSGVSTGSESGIYAAGEALLKRGLKEVYITCGSNGVYAFSQSCGSMHYNALPGVIKNANGAGDAFAAGVLYSLAHGFEPEQTCAFASGCAQFAMMSDEAVNKDLNAKKIAERIN